MRPPRSRPRSVRSRGRCRQAATAPVEHDPVPAADDRQFAGVALEANRPRHLDRLTRIARRPREDVPSREPERGLRRGTACREDADRSRHIERAGADGPIERSSRGSNRRSRNVRGKIGPRLLASRPGEKYRLQEFRPLRLALLAKLRKPRRGIEEHRRGAGDATGRRTCGALAGHDLWLAAPGPSTPAGVPVLGAPFAPPTAIEL